MKHAAKSFVIAAVLLHRHPVRERLQARSQTRLPKKTPSR